MKSQVISETLEGFLTARMELTPEQKMSIERLYENESLTDNLMDADAKALLEWAQQQIISDADGELVKQAVSVANQSGVEGVQALINNASTFLAQELTARGLNTTRVNDAAASMTMRAEDAATREQMRERKAEEMGAIPIAAPMQASGQSDALRVSTAIPSATSIAPVITSAPTSAKKSRGGKKTRKKKS